MGAFCMATRRPGALLSAPSNAATRCWTISPRPWSGMTTLTAVSAATRSFSIVQATTERLSLHIVATNVSTRPLRRGWWSVWNRIVKAMPRSQADLVGTLRVIQVPWRAEIEAKQRRENEDRIDHIHIKAEQRKARKLAKTSAAEQTSAAERAEL